MESEEEADEKNDEGNETMGISKTIEQRQKMSSSWFIWEEKEKSSVCRKSPLKGTEAQEKNDREESGASTRGKQRRNEANGKQRRNEAVGWDEECRSRMYSFTWKKSKEQNLEFELEADGDKETPPEGIEHRMKLRSIRKRRNELELEEVDGEKRCSLRKGLKESEAMEKTRPAEKAKKEKSPSTEER